MPIRLINDDPIHLYPPCSNLGVQRTRLLRQQSLGHWKGLTAMKARRPLDGASFDPPTLKVVGAAFDAAWEEIAWSINKNDKRTIEPARLCLADAILAVANEESRDVARMHSKSWRANTVSQPTSKLGHKSSNAKPL
jgi:hypothetical protein